MPEGRKEGHSLYSGFVSDRCKVAELLRLQVVCGLRPGVRGGQASTHLRRDDMTGNAPDLELLPTAAWRLLSSKCIILPLETTCTSSRCCCSPNTLRRLAKMGQACGKEWDAHWQCLENENHVSAARGAPLLPTTTCSGSSRRIAIAFPALSRSVGTLQVPQGRKTTEPVRVRQAGELCNGQPDVRRREEVEDAVCDARATRALYCAPGTRKLACVIADSERHTLHDARPPSQKLSKNIPGSPEGQPQIHEKTNPILTGSQR